jgi:hypothetical protein
MGERRKKVISTTYKVVEEGHVPRRILSATEIRQRVYGVFEIYGFFVVDDKYLYCFVSYLDHMGSVQYTARQFMSTIEFLPFEIRQEIFSDIAPYLKEKFVKNPHLMITKKSEMERFMKYKPRKIEFL